MKRLMILAAALLLLPAMAAGQVVEYYHLDALGSVRAVTNQAGAVVERHDYLPFGEEWNPPPSVHPRKFTGKERDTETGLDYFGARYYGSKIGRFTTVDPLYTLSENLVDPQRWNRYAYVRNNPLRHVDPNGESVAEAAAWLQAQVNTGREFLVNTAANNLGPYEAAQTTFTVEATARVINALVEPFRVGESTGTALGRGDTGLAFAAAVSEDLGRAGGLILLATALKSPAPEGIVYRRTDLTAGLKPYYGQAESNARYLARQAEHGRKFPNADFEFTEVGRARPGRALDRLEEDFIRRGGGPTNKSNPNGGLSNRRHQMNEKRYRGAGGTE